MKHKIILILILVLGTVPLWAQVNIESKRDANQNPIGLHQKIGSYYSQKSGNTDTLSLNANYRADYYRKKDQFFFLATYDTEETNDTKTANQHFFHLRYIKPFNPTNSLELFLQQEANEFTNLDNRQVVGTAIRFKLKNNIKNLDLFVGVGLILEHEETTNPTNSADFTRSSNYISYSYTLKDNIGLTGAIYYQPALDDFNDFRILGENTLSVDLSKNLALNTTIKIDHDNEPLPGIKKTDTTITQGLSITF